MLENFCTSLTAYYTFRARRYVKVIIMPETLENMWTQKNTGLPVYIGINLHMFYMWWCISMEKEVQLTYVTDIFLLFIVFFAKNNNNNEREEFTETN